MCAPDALSNITETFTKPAAIIAAPTLALPTAAATKGADVALGLPTVREGQQQQEEAIQRAERERTTALETEKANKEKLARQKDERVANQIKAALLRRRASAPTGLTTGAQGIQDRLLQMGKPKLGAA